LKLELNQTQSLLDFSVTQGTNRSLVSTFNADTDEIVDETDADSEASGVRPTLYVYYIKLKYTALLSNFLFRISKQINLNENPYSHKRKRFNIVTKGSSNRFHSDRNQKLEKKLQTLKNTYHEALEKKVDLTRSYRVGK
jgi:hypothetical protein